MTDNRDALIVCIGDFDKNENRPTAHQDALRLELSLAKLKFKCKVLSGRVLKNDIFNAVNEIVKNQGRKDMFLFCFCSHGGEAEKEFELSDGSKERLSNFYKVSSPFC